MCYHRSFIITESLKVLSHPTSDHHTDIRASNGIREEGFHHTEPHCAVEYNPVSNLFDIHNGWDFKVDEKVKPKWWSHEHYDKILSALESDFKRCASIDSTVYKTNRSIEIPYLRNIKSGTVLISNQQVSFACVEDMTDVTVIAPKIEFYDVRMRDERFCRNNKFICDIFKSRRPGFEQVLKRSGQLIERRQIECRGRYSRDYRDMMIDDPSRYVMMPNISYKNLSI